MNEYKVCFEINNKNAIVDNIRKPSQHEAIMEARQLLNCGGDDVPRFKWCQEIK